MTDSRTAEFLKNHPKLLAAMFGMITLLSQAGAVAASANGNTIGG
jgi:hypothetical protein